MSLGMEAGSGRALPLGGPRPRTGGLLGALLVPVVAFVAVQLVFLAAGAAAGADPLRAATWVHWDAIHYLSISDQGYVLRPCRAGEYGFPGNDCGNAAWFPGISWLTALVGLTGAAPVATMLVLACACHLGLLVAVWLGVFGGRWDARSRIGMAFVAVAPGAVWFHAQFPMSLVVLAVVLALVAADRDRWVAAGLATAVACCAYTIGVLVAPVLVLWALLRPAPTRTRVLRAAAIAVPAFAGLLAVLVTMRVQSGAWDAFSQSQARFAYPLQIIPIGNYADRVDDLWSASGTAQRGVALQLLIVTALVVGSVLVAIRRRLRGLRLAAVGFGVLVLVVPLVLGQASNYRSDANLVALAPVVPLLPRKLAWVGVAVLAVLLPVLTIGYVHNYLV